MKRIAVLLVFAAALIGAQSAEAKKPIMSTQKTSFTPTDVDTNGDGKTATIGSGPGTIKTGPLAGTTYSVAAFGEYERLASVQSCPAGDSEFQLIDGWSVTRQSNGPSLFGDLTSRFVCFDPNTFKETFAVTGRITGGLGAYAGASGAFADTGNVVVNFASCDANNNCSGKTNETVLTELCSAGTKFCGGPGGTFSTTYNCRLSTQTCTEDANAPACH